jgi:hypothetical protein
VFNHLADRFDLELFGISIAAHSHLSDCHFAWLKCVWQIRGVSDRGRILAVRPVSNRTTEQAISINATSDIAGLPSGTMVANAKYQ